MQSQALVPLLALVSLVACGGDDPKGPATPPSSTTAPTGPSTGPGTTPGTTPTTPTGTTPTTPTPTPTTTPTDCTEQAWFLDADADGYGDDASRVEACEAPGTDYVAQGGDCDDTEALASPDGVEATCDGIDNDCDPVTVDDPDYDADGVSECEGDCNDLDPAQMPGGREVLCDGVDNDCDPATPDDDDLDADGVSTCAGDCDDADPTRSPNVAEQACDGIDNDCDPATSDTPDADADGVGFCDGDCDDDEPIAAPGFAEAACDGVDNDCDPATTDTPDADGDGVGACYGDCDDTDATVRPGRLETTCDGVDNDCDPATADAPDADADGVGFCDGDCDDGEPLAAPGFVETACDGVDNDCDPATVDTPDADADGVGQCDGDCDDLDPLATPGSVELACDGIDNDCRTDTPDGPDDDADGVGLCSGDCDDLDPGVAPGRPEQTCDGIDNDCDPSTLDAPDADADGVGLCNGDCDDLEPLAAPGLAEQLCDGVDNDCDATTPDGVDSDGDGATCADDCDDDDPRLFVGNLEDCNGLDSDCDGAVDDNAVCPCTQLTSPEGVAYMLCTAGLDGATAATDCETFGYALATVDDATENDWLASQLVDAAWIGLRDDIVEGDFYWVDGTAGGFTAWAPGQPDDAGTGEDCVQLGPDGLWSDGDCTVPRAYVCEAGCAVGDWFLDADGDGYGDGSIGITTTACTQPFGYVRNADDCDDTDATVHPAAAEQTCDGVDNDCDLATDDAPDGDGDGFGVCVDDCDDADPTVFPGATEQICDGLDNDCDPLTLDDPGGFCAAPPTALFDDFEAGVPAPEWLELTGDAAIGTTDVFAGSYSLTLGGGGGSITSWPLDLSACPTSVLVAFWMKRGPEQPDIGEFLDVTYDLGAGPVSVTSIEGGANDPAFVRYTTSLADPAVRVDGVSFTFSTLGSGVGFDDFHIDDVTITCDLGADDDGDGVTTTAGDCDDLDPTVFPGNIETVCDGIDNDCDGGTLDSPDADGDGVGFCSGDCDDDDPTAFPGNVETLCDGVDNDCSAASPDTDDGDGDGVDACNDCDDLDPSVFPGATDTADGVDSDCDGLDHALFFDDFELGLPDPALWSAITGDYLYSTTYAAGGAYSLQMGGGIATATSLPIDTTSCFGGVGYALKMKRGPETPDSTDFLELSYDPVDPTMAGATVATTWFGVGTTETVFTAYGEAFGVDAASPTLHLQLYSQGSGVSFDHFFVDDLAVGCLP